MVGDIILIVLAVLCIVVGVIGSIIPVLPGPPIAYLGMWLGQWSGFVHFSQETLIIWAAVTVFVTLIDYYLPAWFTKKFGGSKKAMWGATLGLIAALILPFGFIGILIAPFLGAYLGEIIHDNSDQRKALKVAFGSFVAFICGTGMKMVSAVWMGVLLIKGLWVGAGASADEVIVLLMF